LANEVDQIDDNCSAFKSCGAVVLERISSWSCRVLAAVIIIIIIILFIYFMFNRPKFAELLSDGIGSQGRITGEC